MKTQLMRILFILLAISLVSAVQLRRETIEQEKVTKTEDYPFKLSHLYRFYDNSAIEELIVQLKGQNTFSQLEIIKNFMFENNLFFSAEQIVSIMKSTVANTVMSNYFIDIIKPYIPLLSTEEANRIVQLVYSPQDGLAFSTIVSQIYDMTEANLNAFQFSIGEDAIYQERYIIPQSKKSFSNGFKLTFEGQHVGLLISKSKSMKTVAVEKENGTQMTRFNLVQEFLNEKKEFLQDFSAFTYGQFTSETDLPFFDMSMSVQGFESIMGLEYFMQGSEKFSEESDLFGSLERFLQIPYDQISDLYLITDGTITVGSHETVDFINLINQINSVRKIKVRINTISAFTGNNISESEKAEKIKLLKAISNTTGGTFIQL